MAKPEVSSTPSSGLGRGLGGILDDAMGDARAPEVSSLLGIDAARRAPEVRLLVTELALQALSDSFDTLGLMLVRRHPDRSTAAVSARIPSSWSLDDPLGFEVAGRLWTALGATSDTRSQTDLDGNHLLVSRQLTGGSTVAAAVLRALPFSESEQRVIDRLLRSVSTALGESSPIPASMSLVVSSVVESVGRSAEGAPRHFEATVELAADNTESTSMVGIGSSSTPTMATAAAALELCAVPMTVRFAGSTLINDHQVSLVVVEESGGGPLFGLAVGLPDDASGAAEAALAAAAVIDVGPFSGPVEPPAAS